ncbi:MAG: tripartite tricarboxylate transporter substrate binding protein [Proteobacteria bacterium]|nr:tripartite tricarboxylate transporter substrate binding protein [Pseudomonadota bacterium]
MRLRIRSLLKSPHFADARLGAVGSALARSLLVLALAAGPVTPAFADWPERPITLVVMYSPGGGTDTMLRALAAEMASATGWRINVVNRPGAAGAVATRYVLNRPADGYTMLGASNFNKYSRISGGGDSVSWRDWYYMRAASGSASWSVRPDSPFRTFADVVEEARANPGTLTISTSGTGGQWHEFAAVVAQAAGIELRYVPYNSGQLATLAGLNGEVDITGGGVHEHIQYVDAGQLIPLQQTSLEDIVTPSGRVMPSLVNYIPGIRDQLPPSGAYNLGIRRDTPPEIIRQVEAAFVAATESEAFRTQVAERHFAVDLLIGPEADRRAAQVETISASVFEELMIPGARTAEELGLPLPEEFDQWWPPPGYSVLPIHDGG